MDIGVALRTTFCLNSRKVLNTQFSAYLDWASTEPTLQSSPWRWSWTPLVNGPCRSFCETCSTWDALAISHSEVAWCICGANHRRRQRTEKRKYRFETRWKYNHDAAEEARTVVLLVESDGLTALTPRVVQRHCILRLQA